MEWLPREISDNSQMRNMGQLYLYIFNYTFMYLNIYFKTMNRNIIPCIYKKMPCIHIIMIVYVTITYVIIIYLFHSYKTNHSINIIEHLCLRYCSKYLILFCVLGIIIICVFVCVYDCDCTMKKDLEGYTSSLQGCLP